MELETLVAWDFGIQEVILKILLMMMMVGCWFGYNMTLLMVPSPYSCLLTFTLMLKSCGWWWVQLDYSVSSGPFWTMNFEFQDLSLAIIC